MPRPTGLYEVLITDRLALELAALRDQFSVGEDMLRSAEVGDRLALHLGVLLRRALSAIPEAERVSAGVHLARELVRQIHAAIPAAGTSADSPNEAGRVLRAILARLPDGTPDSIPNPLIPLLDTTLLTNSPGEPRVGSQVLAEIASADRVDVVMAFIRRTGLAPLKGALRRHCEHGRPLRVLTTTYTGTTELAALELLSDLGAQIRISYDTGATRLHAKAWLFHRESGFSTAYVGSSNLTQSAQITGLEWNVRVSGARNADVVDKIRAVFEAYWANPDFVPFNRDEFVERARPVDAEAPDFILSPIEIRLEPFQERLLEQVELSREQGHHRNLLVSATGTGKTVMAAVDYSRLRTKLARSRLLFVAHREEILSQSLATFRHALRDPTFGELWVGGHTPQRFENVFASIQNLHADRLTNLDPGHFDIVIVDEFHHAAAQSYLSLLSHINPTELLGLTATPERTDGLPILQWFDGRIAAELRLWDAINQHRLCPFVYFGIHDGTDLRSVQWQRGRGYDVDGLTNLLTADDAWARLVLQRLIEHVGDVRRIRALGFCVSIEHARFMARAFASAGVAAKAVWADTPPDERRRALEELRTREINVLFSVDLFNEGVDVPMVDTLLFLRPTDSGTLFLQQLGRGLRISDDKAACTVLDFVGHHRKEFRYDRRFEALLGGTRRERIRQIGAGFPFLPAGCHLELDAIASEIVLRNIRESVPANNTARIADLRELSLTNLDITLATFIDETGVDLDDIYSAGRSWSDLREAAGLDVRPPGTYEVELRRACGRLLHIDDRSRIQTYRELLSRMDPPDPRFMQRRQQRVLRMLIASVLNSVMPSGMELAEACRVLWDHSQIRNEILEQLAVLDTRIEHIHVPLDARFPDVPLLIHARYSRLEILAAFGEGREARVPLWQTGVYWAEAARTDLLAFTLDKTSGQFSPTTRYRDYAISRELIHWESQSVTRSDSETGLRYQRHEAYGSNVLLFARLRTDDRAFWFLGPAKYVSHEGEQPMAVVWRLDHPLPGDLFAAFAAAVA